MKAEADLVENAQIRSGQPRINKGIHDIGVACPKERGIRVILKDLDFICISKLTRRLVPQMRDVRAPSLTRNASAVWRRRAPV